MNCDQAFDAMTDPHGFDSYELSCHLDKCTRCQQMYETLEPALGLFNTPEYESTSEYEHHAAHPVMPSVQMAEQVAARLFSNSSTSKPLNSRSQLWGTVFAATALGLMLMLSVSLLFLDARPSTPAMATQCTWLNRNAFSGGESATLVTSTCVKCHLKQDVNRSNGQTSFIRYSNELEQMVRYWQQTVHAPDVNSTLIAQSDWEDRHDV